MLSMSSISMLRASGLLGPSSMDLPKSKQVLTDIACVGLLTPVTKPEEQM